jgi:hypothetical protein
MRAFYAPPRSHSTGLMINDVRLEKTQLCANSDAIKCNEWLDQCNERSGSDPVLFLDFATRCPLT